ncbi:MAG: hypothetical protein H2060_00880 [Azoarcus sp.]|nr:hypothetical protein [Azoarcus sp.]
MLLHLWLLLSFRHSGSGLPRSWPPVFALIVLASLFAALRWEVLHEPYTFPRPVELSAIAFALFFWLVLIAMISTRFASGYALVSIGADCATMVLAMIDLFGPGVRMAILFVEIVALARLATVLLRSAGSRGH